MGTSKNLLRAPITVLGGARNPHVFHIHYGFCPCAQVARDGF
jgi:hypothetical protein